MDMSISDEIKEATSLINAAGSWGLNEFLVFLFVIFVMLVLVIFYFAQRNSSKTTDAILQMNDKSNEAINNNTIAMRSVVDKILESQSTNSKKLEDIHDDVKEIKLSVRHRQNLNYTNGGGEDGCIY